MFFPDNWHEAEQLPYDQHGVLPDFEDQEELELDVKDFGPIPDKWQHYFNELRDAGYDWQQFSPYHFRIEQSVDFWPPRQKWYVPYLGKDNEYIYQKGQGLNSLLNMLRKMGAAQ